METILNIDLIPMMYVEAEGGPVGARSAFHALEHKFGSLRGRKFYGLIYDEGRKYLACAALVSETEPKILGLPVITLSGGKYVRVRLEDWSDKLGDIFPTFQGLAKRYAEDTARPRVEFYRSQKELFLMLPIR